jgi:dethiobiotin synthetase
MPPARRSDVTAIFITATGPEVGETRVTISLMRMFAQMGHMVEAVKPIVCGYDPARPATSPTGTLVAEMRLPFVPKAIGQTSPWRFRAALPPDLAAQREGRIIDIGEVAAFCRSAMERRRDVLLIEGIGGVMAPLDGQRTTLDVMMALHLPVVLVTSTDAGAISHTLTAADSLYRRDLNVVAIIVCESPAGALPLDDMVAALSRFLNPVIGLPRDGQIAPGFR